MRCRASRQSRLKLVVINREQLRTEVWQPAETRRYDQSRFRGREMATQATPQRQLLWTAFILLVLLAGLCTIFASVVTAAEAWQEHAQARWPEVTAHIDRCGMDRTSTGRRNGFYIDCRLSYATGPELNTTRIYSRTAHGPDVWQYPPNQIGPLQEWMDAHPPGTTIVVRYDPANPRKVVLVNSDLPGAGPRTASNIKQVEFWGISFVVLVVIVSVRKKRLTTKGSLNPS